MSGRRLAWWFTGAFALGLVLALPLELVLRQTGLPPGLSAAGIKGSAWRGRLRQARWQNASLGDLRLGLSPLSLATGRRTLRLRTPQASLSLHDGRLRGVARANGVLPLPGPQGLALRASLEDAAMLFDGDGCRDAGGRVRVELALPGDALPPLILSGTPACEGRDGRIALVPEDVSGPLRLEATLSVERDGAWRLQALARSDDPAVRAALSVNGFQEAPGGFSRVVEGRLGAP